MKHAIIYLDSILINIVIGIRKSFLFIKQSPDAQASGDINPINPNPIKQSPIKSIQYTSKLEFTPLYIHKKNPSPHSHIHPIHSLAYFNNIRQPYLPFTTLRFHLINWSVSSLPRILSTINILTLPQSDVSTQELAKW